ncbi:TVP38/TMEM64 family protein [Paenibacillus sp. CCS19]|uniref:TVP38/TMEM64 family protein n=1 Tax=Paenibacillus sp. CCS19 TaxID=3158387 RepID=UPI00256A8568|nr:VTT domain-containing protein [Paenibacillus cellulosilyticus]GMK40766.1 TVP38/TMEM64 family protein [Paenibacillus cellulosilyticus]
MESIFSVNKTAEWLQEFGIWAIMISLLLNIIISILGIVPSVFLSGANAIVFGLPLGFTLSLVGEALGAFVTYGLYRKGILTIRRKNKRESRWSRAFMNARQGKQFSLLLIARIIPFLPSGLITFIAAWTKMNIVTFMLATILGKAPSVAAEVWFGQNMFNVMIDML